MNLRNSFITISISNQCEKEEERTRKRAKKEAHSETLKSNGKLCAKIHKNEVKFGPIRKNFTS